MKNCFKIIIAFVTFFAINSSHVVAQISEAFAGGEITYAYAGNGLQPCTGPQPYHFTLKFYRDCFPTVANDKTINIYSQKNNTLLTVKLTQVQDRGNIDNLCVKGDPICTRGLWYSTNNPVNLPFPANDWKIFYGNIPMGNIANGIDGRPYHSPANLNVETGQRFFIFTQLSNLSFCGEVEGVLQDDITDTLRRVNNSFNTSARWLTPDIVETFCHGQTYNYKLPVVDDDEFEIDLNLNNNSTNDIVTYKDSLSYDMTGALKRNGATVQYLTSEGYTPSSPFPSSGPIKFDKKDGILSFTPELAPSETSFIGVVSFRVYEWRTYFFIDSVCLKLGGGCTPAELTPIIRTGKRVINTTLRQMRFVIDKNCNKNLPDFEGITNNWTGSAWEFDCADTTLDFRMDKPMLAKDALDDPKWLSMYRGKPGQPRDDNAIGIDSIVPLNTTALGEFTRFRVYMYEPIGPGDYTLFPKPNKKLTGIKNRCGFELAENSVQIPIYVNTDYTYIFQDKGKTLEFCNPADLPFEVDALRGQPKLKSVASLYTWAYTQFDPNTVRDTFYAPNSKYNLPVDTNIQGDPEYRNGRWTAGVGLDFGYTYNDTVYPAYCYDEDNFQVLFFENDPVEIPNFDLCAHEPWPLINLDSMTSQPQNAENYIWTYYNAPKNRWDTVGGNSNSGKKNDYFEVASIGAGLGNTYTITSEVELENGKCFERDTFFVSKQVVKVKLTPPNDSTICPGYEYMLYNTITYLVPDSMSYQWFLDDDSIPGADSSSVRITKRGMYKLEVTKHTENSSCMGWDSVYINVADSLGVPEPVCTQITFKNGDIEQTFFVPSLKGAEEFQVRQIDPFGVEGPWENPNNGALDHILIGKQLRLEARGVNLEVEVTAPCRFGPIGIAKACDAVVKEVNVFTPNGDGINEYLRFDLLEVYPGSPLQIFNRWGDLIFETDNYENNWDGEDHAEGTYFYILDINDESQGILKGTFTILR